MELDESEEFWQAVLDLGEYSYLDLADRIADLYTEMKILLQSVTQETYAYMYTIQKQMKTVLLFLINA